MSDSASVQQLLTMLPLIFKYYREVCYLPQIWKILSMINLFYLIIFLYICLQIGIDPRSGPCNSFSPSWHRGRWNLVDREQSSWRLCPSAVFFFYFFIGFPPTSFSSIARSLPDPPFRRLRAPRRRPCPWPISLLTFPSETLIKVFSASRRMPSSLSCARLTAWTIAAVALQILGLSLFVIGFFPVKPTLRGFRLFFFPHLFLFFSN